MLRHPGAICNCLKREYFNDINKYILSVKILYSNKEQKEKKRRETLLSYVVLISTDLQKKEEKYFEVMCSSTPVTSDLQFITKQFLSGTTKKS